MAIVFGKTGNTGSTRSVVDEVFNRDTVVLDETDGEAKTPAGHLAVIRNYRGHTAKSPGRKNPNMGQTMLSLSSLGMVPVTELSRLVERLRTLQGELESTLG